MQEHKPDNSPLMDFKAAKVQALRAINLYLRSESKDAGGDRYGQYHGESGINRANNLKKCLEAISDDNHAAILAVLLAVFGKPSAGLFGISPGRSSSLSSMIADSFITGESHHGAMGLIDIETLQTNIFSPSILAKATADKDAVRIIPNGEMSSLYFDKTKGIRIMLQEILCSPKFSTDKKAIEAAAKTTSSLLTSKTFKINLTIFESLKNKFQVYKENIAAEFMKSASLPPEIGTDHLSQFFTTRDAGKTAEVNKGTAEAAKKTNPFKKNRGG